MPHRFYIVDVFAEQSYSGNPLAVVVGDKALSDETMQHIAADINFSETTFVAPVPENNEGYRVRIFTPAKEIAFAGHPILGTAHILRHHIVSESKTRIQLNLSESQITVTFESSPDGRELAWFLAPPMSLGVTTSIQPVAVALGISPEDIETKPPIQVVSAGTSAMIVPLRNLDALRRSKLNLDAFTPLASEGFPPLVYLFCQETHHPQNDLCARFFFDAHGVREDPATGNGAAFLGAYLLEHQFFSKPSLYLRIEQGYEIRRPSLVLLRTRIKDGVCEVFVGGYVIPTVQGELI